MNGFLLQHRPRYAARNFHRKPPSIECLCDSPGKSRDGSEEKDFRMDCTLQEHILRLEYRIQQLNDLLTASRRPEDNERIVSELQTARLALRLYREAYDMEQKLPVARA